MVRVRRLCVVFAFLMVAGGALAQQAVRVAERPGDALERTTDNLLRGRGGAVPRSSNDALVRQQQVRSTLLSLIGPLPEPGPLHPVTLGTTSLPGVRIEKVLFDSQPFFHVTALLYLPDVTLVRALPAIVLPSSDGPQGKSADFWLAMAFVRNGFAVLSYDRIGQGERLQSSSAGYADASLQPILLGESIAKYLVWDAMRAVDYLQTRGEIDPARIGAFGCSGAGADVALLAALDTRIAATGTACYLTSFSALLHSNAGVQDAEQALPGLIRRRLDYADYVEAAAPRPYAIIATQGDYLPFAGTRDTEREARSFYSVFDALLPTVNVSRLGSNDARDLHVAYTPSAAQNLAFITAPLGHGDLKPMLPRILKFFSDTLQSTVIAPVYDEQSSLEQAPPGALRVTPTGQVATFNLHAATVYSLNLAHSHTIPESHPDNLPYLRGEINLATGIELAELKSIAPEQIAIPGDGGPLPADGFLSRMGDPVEAREQAPRTVVLRRSGTSSAVPWSVYASLYRHWNVTFTRHDVTSRGPVQFGGELYVPQTIPQPGAEPTLALILAAASGPPWQANLDTLLRKGEIVLVVYPEPIATSSDWFRTSLRYTLVGKTILGRRIEDILSAIDYLSLLKTPHKPGIEAYADGHLALALVHAAVFDSQISPRIAHLHLTNLPPSYAQMLAAPVPGDVWQDILPGVLRRYDVPDLLAAIYGR